jgi:hypothetical protein
MKRFLQRHAGQIKGVLNGFDRMRFRGTLRWLAYTDGMRGFLNRFGVLLKDFKSYVQNVTERISSATEQLAKAHGRSVIYLNSPKISKEEQARQIAQEKRIRRGLICVFSAVESCYSYEIHRNAQTRHLELNGRPSKCKHYYFYLRHPEFGFMHLRLQTWFPLNIHIAINGREWLAQQLDAAGIGYRRQDNCFLSIADVRRAQALCNQQLHTRWKSVFQTLLDQFHPSHADLFDPSVQYYWSLEQSEWASDVMFRSPQTLAQLYPHWLRHAAYDFSSAEVMRFLGRKVPAHGGVRGNFQGDVVSDVARRADRLRVKHRVNGNWLKMYDKQDLILRVETTLNHTQDFQVFRRHEGQTKGKRMWLPLRKGVADIRRRAQVSQAANARYLEALADVQATVPLGELTKSICQPTELNGRRVRALQPWSESDAKLLAAVNRPEFNLNGFRNRDLRPLLFGSQEASAEETRRQSAKVSRQLRMLRAHKLIAKVTHTHCYRLTANGRTILTALQAARQANAAQLTKMAA